VRSPYRKTITVAIVHVAASAVATAVAVQRDLPAHVFNMASDRPVSHDWVSRGTALSAPLQMLAILTVLIVLTALRWRGRSIAAVGIVIYGGLSLLGSLFEHVVPRAFSPSSFDPVPAILIVTVAGTSLLMVVFGCQERISHRKRAPGGRTSAAGNDCR
jgi:hypothetical protein